jgi:hypothetical protein
MPQFARVVRKPAFAFSAALVIALIAEFALLEGALGVSLSADRNSAMSRLEIKVKGTELHFVTQNRQFTVVDLLTVHGTRSEALVLLETFFIDRKDGVEGPPNATVTVEAMNGKDVRWAFHEPGERGEAVTGDVYQVTKFGCCDAPPTYTYYSLRDGTKLRSIHNKLNSDELEALDRSVIN